MEQIRVSVSLKKSIIGRLYGNIEVMSKENKLIRKGYDTIAPRYVLVRDQFKNDQYLEKLDALLKPGSAILDLGCGAGMPIDKFLVDRGHQVTGIDFSSKMIDLAKRHVPEAKYLVRDISELKRGEFRVDAVVSFYAIIHIPKENHRELFTRINSFLPGGGLILVTLGKEENEEIGDYHGVEMYWSHYGPEQSREIIEEAGFEVIIDEIDAGGEEKCQYFLARKTG